LADFILLHLAAEVFMEVAAVDFTVVAVAEGNSNNNCQLLIVSCQWIFLERHSDGDDDSSKIS
jgi:hypothetical protein